ncbi:MAG: branched-chain amino acid ABC transporter permease [Acidimicrobiales bacterium]
MAQVVVSGIGAGAVYGLFALGLVLVFKATRVLNFAQAEMGTFTTYLAWWLLVRQGIGWPLTVVIVLAAAALIGLVFERTVMRPLVHASRLTLVVATVAASLLFGALELKIWRGNPKLLPSPFHGSGLHIAGVFITPPRLLALALTAAVGAGFAWFFRRTTFGLALLASAQDAIGVRLTGIRLRHLSAFTWAASAVIGAAAGLVIALSLGAFAEYFMARIMLLGFAAAILGGMTSLPGALVGGLGVGVGEAVVSHYWIRIPGLVEALTFAMIVAVLIVRPQGLLGREA